jgi:hypothetical protein
MTTHRPCFGTALARIVLAALAAGCLAVAGGRLAEPWTPPADPAAHGPEAERGRRLDDQMRVVRRRVAEKARVARQVAAGWLSLVDAAAAYRDLDRDDPNYNADPFRRAYPGGSDEERYCRQVITFATRLVPFPGEGQRPPQGSPAGTAIRPTLCHASNSK